MIVTLVCLYLVGLLILLLCIRIAKKSGIFNALRGKELEKIQYQTQEEKKVMYGRPGMNAMMGLIYLSVVFWPIVLPVFMIKKAMRK